MWNECEDIIQEEVGSAFKEMKCGMATGLEAIVSEFLTKEGKAVV